VGIFIVRISFETMTSLWHHLWTLDIATVPLKSSCNEQCAVIVFLWAKRLDATQIHSQMHPVYGDKCFTKPIAHVWCRKMLMLGGRNLHWIPRCNKSFISALNSSQHLFCIGHSETCWHRGQMFEWIWTTYWKMKCQCLAFKKATLT